MNETQFEFWNRILGWSIFGIALLTFGITVEPTASFWDASEYIATSAKLQVGHPPGAPFYQMMGAFFAMFAMRLMLWLLLVGMVLLLGDVVLEIGTGSGYQTSI